MTQQKHKTNLSQSTLKTLSAYANKDECGAKIVFDSLAPSEPSEAQLLGLYFEYMATGAKTREGKVPMPPRNKAAKGEELGDIPAEFRRMKEQAVLYRELIKEIGFVHATDKDGKKLIGYRIAVPYEDREIDGIMDNVYIATKDIPIVNYEKEHVVTKIIKTGEKVILDVKSTSLLMDKYDKYGWHPNSLPERDLTTLQPTMYKWLWRQQHNEDIHFMWAVFSTKPDLGISFMYADTDEQRFDDLEKQYIPNAMPLLKKLDEGVLKPYPEYNRCKKCDYIGECKFAAKIPSIWNIAY